MKGSRFSLFSYAIIAGIVTITFSQAVVAGGHRATEKRYFSERTE